MAVLGTIRKRGTLLIIIIGLGLFAFIAEEMFRSCEATSNERRQQVGEVCGQRISVQEFQEMVDEYQNAQKLTQGVDNLTDEQLNALKDQVWNAYVTNTILKTEAEKLGLTVTDEELQNVLKEGTEPLLLQSPFVNQQTRRFDVTMLTKFLAEVKKIDVQQNAQMAEYYQSIQNYWRFIEKTLRQELLSRKYQVLLKNCLLTNPQSVQAAMDGQNIESTVLLAIAPYSNINDKDVQVTDAELKSKYNEDKEKYKQFEESRDIKYVEFHVSASAADHKALMDAMNTAYNNLQNGGDAESIVRKAQSSVSYTGLPVTKKAFSADIAAKLDSMQVGQTIKPFENKADNTLNLVKLISKVSLPDSVEYRQIQVGGASVEEARKTADSIYNALKGGADFEALAKKYGQEGKSQWLTSAMYERSSSVDSDTKAFLEALNNTPVNEVKNLAFAQGNVVIQIVNRKAFVDKYVTAVIKHTIDFSKDTYSAAYNKFSQYVSECSTIEDLEKKAANYGFKVSERKNLFNNEHYVAGIRGTRDALKWVFETKEGTISPLYECGNNDCLLVVAMNKIHAKGYADLEDVKADLEAELKLDKKYDVLKGKYASLKSVAEAKSKGMIVDTVKQITFGAPAYVKAIGASEPALSGAVASAKQGSFSDHLVKGKQAAYLFQVLKKGEKENAYKDAKAIDRQLQMQNSQMVFNRLMYNLYQNAKVVDNRYLFF
ncbi:MAG: peptidylprolyl isomerase [Prevotella sp.]